MPTGLAGRFNILQQSPHDSLGCTTHEAPILSPVQHWVPSRYNIRATAEDGRLVLWNSLSGKIAVFKAEHREGVISLLQRKGFEHPKENVVGYLVDCGFLVRKGVNEYRQFQRLFGEQHYRSDVLELILMASEDCNFRCTYCYEDFARGTMLPSVRQGVKNLVSKRIQKLNRLHISWFGGEPLYGIEAIEDLAPYLLGLAREHGVPFTSHMTTNGYLLDKEMADRLFSWSITNFQITLDGLPEHHNHSRPARDGGPTFDTILNNLKSLAARDESFRVMLRVNFDHVNSPGLSNFVEVLADAFRHDPRFVLSLRPVGQWGGPNDAELEVCGNDDAQRIQTDLVAEARRQGLSVGSLRDASRVGSQTCYAARPFNFLIGASGKVMKCTVSLDKDENNVVGRITPEGELQLDEERLALWTEPVFEQDGKCRKCVVLPTCQGSHCPLIRLESNTQPCTSVRSNPKGALLDILNVPTLSRSRVGQQRLANAES
jgi:uncharacterized protein